MEWAEVIKNGTITGVVLNTGYFSYSVVVLGSRGLKVVGLNFRTKLGFEAASDEGGLSVGTLENFADNAAILSSIERVVVTTSAVVVVEGVVVVVVVVVVVAAVVVVEVVVVTVVVVTEETEISVVAKPAEDIFVEASVGEISVVEDAFSS